jgi:[acyl-carrier-protein] S-malonyltransferase
MVKRAFIFPGQGAQFVGMSKDFYETFDESKAVFEQAQEIVDFDLKKICFQGPLEELSLTSISQPAILTASVAALKALQAKGLKTDFQFTAGLSLGEYSALVAAESLSFTDALSLVAKRGKFMQQASKENPGSMLTILGLDLDKVNLIAEKSQTYIANLNCPGQIVISGRHDNLKKAEELAKENGAKRAILLKVSGPFHTELMQQASLRLKDELDKADLRPPKIEVIFNVTAQSEDDPQEIRINLFKQVSQTTYWQKSVEFMIAKGVEEFIEIGPSNVLKGLLKRINRELKVINVGAVEDLKVFNQ